MKSRAIDMTGKRYSSLVAIRPTEKMKNGNMKWQFICDCGVECEIDGYNVRSGKTTTCQVCGAERLRLASVKHGISETPEFSTWADIQSRCYNKKGPSYKDYGGRGIKVCKKWLDSFQCFFSDMGVRPSRQHSIDRIDNDGDYEPENCRWATINEQANNKRSNRKVTINGQTKNLHEWAKKIGISDSALSLRLKNNLPVNDLLKPSQRGGTLTYNSITDTYSGWSKRAGIKESTIAMRISAYKWSIEKTLTKGATL